MPVRMRRDGDEDEGGCAREMTGIQEVPFGFKAGYRTYATSPNEPAHSRGLRATGRHVFCILGMLLIMGHMTHLGMTIKTVVWTK